MSSKAQRHQVVVWLEIPVRDSARRYQVGQRLEIPTPMCLCFFKRLLKGRF
jgi:hypothetical protein